MRTRPPLHTEFFVFGSAVEPCCSTRDIDLLVRYDSDVISPSSVYGAIRRQLGEIQATTGLRVHATVLSEREARAEDFIRAYGCVPWQEWVEAWSRGPTSASSGRRQRYTQESE